MPGFDGTGPRGMGPMTGGGRGFCNPYGPLYGRGPDAGWSPMVVAPGPAPGPMPMAPAAFSPSAGAPPYQAPGAPFVPAFGRGFGAGFGRGFGRGRGGGRGGWW